MKQLKINFIAIVLAIFLLTPAALAQTTVFTFQGKLQSSSAPANGNFDFEFLLLDAASGGSQIGSTNTRNGIAVADGIFSVNLDFGAGFPGASRFLEIRVRQTGGGAFTQLTPRQPVTSTPYSVKSLTAESASNAVNATNAVNAANATNAATAVNFSGALVGDVTGNQNTTTVANLRAVPLPAPVVADNGKVLKYKNNGVDPITLEWATDNTSAGGGGVTSVTASGPLVSSGGATPNISLTGVVPAANGGTGVSAAGAAGNLLRSNGTAWTSSALQAADVPAGNSNYVQNTTTQQAASNFNISGNGIIGGNVGIGTANPQAKLDVNGTAQIASGGSGGQVVFGAPNGESGMLISGTSRADIRFDGSTLKLLAGVSTGAPISTNGIAIATSGNVGIGVTSPTTRLHVLSPAPGVSAIYGESSSGRGVWGKSTGSSRGVYGESVSGEGVFGISPGGAGVSGTSTSGSGVYGESPVSSLTAAGVYGKGTGSGSIGVIGESNIANAVGVFGVSTSPGGVGVYARNNSGGRAIFAEGNVAQNRNTNGLVKAMIYVSQNGTILNCYNGITNVSTGTCGFVVIRNGNGVYFVDFNFQVDDRFISITTRDPNVGNTHVGANFFFFNPDEVRVSTFITNVETFGNDANFMIIVY